MKKENKTSRRDFLKQSMAVGAGVVAMTSVAGCNPKTSAADIQWDKETDLIVVGSGTVAVAALTAAKAGAKVIILEKGLAFGGTTALSGGGFWVPNNQSMQKQGIEDNREDAIKYLKIVTGEQSSDEMIESYVDNAPKMSQFLSDSFGWEFGTSAGKAYADYYDMKEGSRPYGRTIYMYQDGSQVGAQIMYGVFKATLEEMGVEILLETPGKKLITNDAGEVIGIIAELDGEDIAIKANKGVILGTGGFDFNKEMTHHFLRGPIYVSNSVSTNTGDGHIMGMELGADLRNMNESWGLPAFLLDEETLKGEVDWQMYRGKPGAIVVNKHGERIGNEASSYELFQRSFYNWDSGMAEWRNIPSFFIADRGYTDNYFLPGSGYQVGVVPDWMAQADNLEELCEKLGIDWAGLQATLEVFNVNAAEGIDPIWHRGDFPFDVNTAGDMTGRTDLKNNCLAPIENGPFVGAAYYPGTCGTNGGLRINQNGQVLHVRGNPIPRLYAVGNTSGSVMGAAYPGGGSTLGAGFTYGWLAANHAISQELAS
ncbi:MAG: FAD-binding protein [Anaerolineaceae bacterium]|nr:FAD-binding protein [Anaerolineaceae bacterium]